jgi:stage V sporulation protein R
VEGLKVDREYMRNYINPPEFLADQHRRIDAEKLRQKRFPENPQKDILLFLLNYAPLERWQYAILEIIRNESYYFAPQGMTKILNEGWASYWHSLIMTRKALRPSEVISFADLHSGVVATGSGKLNPYKLGIELLRDVEERWDKGKFGKEYDDCDNIAEKRQWDKQLGLGKKKLFEIRRLYNDVTFIDEFLTPEFVIENKLFTFRYNRDTDVYEIASRQFQEIKEKLLFSLTNFGQPFIAIEDANYNNRGELYLKHRHEGVDLQMDYARDTLRNLYKLWTRPIYLETLVDDRRRLLSFDGRNIGERRLE